MFKLKKDVADTESYLFGTGLAVNLKTVKIMEHLQWLTSPILWNVPCKMTTQFTQELQSEEYVRESPGSEDMEMERPEVQSSQVVGKG